MRWIGQLFARIFGIIAEHPAIGYVARVAIGIAAILVVARVAYSLFLGHGSPRLAHGPRGVGRASDWWATAQRLAAQGNYTDAAHALYRALIATAALRGLVSLHDSKTSGDYLRELRRSADSTDIIHFTDFTRSYETIIYGIGNCDAERYDRLQNLAGNVLGTAAGAGA